jgi:hypothetical protein
VNITKDGIEERMAQLARQKEAAFADLNAIDGAMQDCQYWLSQIEKEEVSNDDDDKDKGSQGGKAKAGANSTTKTGPG